MNVAQVAKVNPNVLTPLMVPGNPLTTRQARRLYLGNIPPDITEAELTEFVNTAMVTSKLSKSGGPPVANCQMNKEKLFAFVEMRTPEDASAGMAFDGITLKGYALKVRRPRDYAGNPGLLGLAPEEDFPDPNVPRFVGTNVPDSEHKIFCGGLPNFVTEDQIKALFSAYGQLKAFHLVKDSATGNSKGYAFLEYVDHSLTDKACAGLNGTKIGEKTLVVQRSQPNSRQQQVLVARPGSAELMTSNPTAINFLNLALPIPTTLQALTVQGNPPPTRVLTIVNGFSVEELASDTDYADILQDMSEEAAKHGQVMKLIIPRPIKIEKPFEPFSTPEALEAPPPGYVPPPPPPKNTYVAGLGRVYIEYASPEQATKAQQAIAGRKFGKRTLITAFYPEALWADGKLDGPAPPETLELA
jgi:splicing factor U2AF subunit